MRRRALLYAALALIVPLPALALTGDEEAGGEGSLAVSASLDSCGTAADTIVCKIDATWNQIPGATRYTASVTRADGTVVDFGDVGAGSGSFWVPYVGNGAYTVTVSAYGTPPGEEREEVVARGTSNAGETEGGGTAASAGQAATGGEVATGDPEAPGGPTSVPAEPECEEPVEPPVPEEPPAAPEAPPDPGASDALAPEAEAALDETAAVPETVTCPSDLEAAAG
jgi:hypothetical protein